MPLAPEAMLSVVEAGANRQVPGKLALVSLTAHPPTQALVVDRNDHIQGVAGHYDKKRHLIRLSLLETYEAYERRPQPTR
jgi:hypothetical protein